MQIEFLFLKAEIGAMKADMVIKEAIQSLESRVASLEIVQHGRGSGKEVVWMQQQMSRFDPANKSLFFKGLTQQNPATRTNILEEYFASIDDKDSIVSIEHHWTGRREIVRYLQM